jgi:hypothetical protein
MTLERIRRVAGDGRAPPFSGLYEQHRLMRTLT